MIVSANNNFKLTSDKDKANVDVNMVINADGSPEQIKKMIEALAEAAALHFGKESETLEERAEQDRVTAREFANRGRAIEHLLAELDKKREEVKQLNLIIDDREKMVRSGNEELTKLQIKLSEVVGDLRTTHEKLVATDEMWSEDIMASKARETGLRDRISDLENKLKLSETSSACGETVRALWEKWDNNQSNTMRSGRSWSKKEEEDLIAAFIRAPRNIKKLSQRHGRTEWAILTRLGNMGLIQMIPSSGGGESPSYSYTDMMLQKVIEYSKK